MKHGLFEQPFELLLKQLSDPDITLEDIKNFCMSSKKARELCQTNPLFIKLIQGKRYAIKIYRDIYSRPQLEIFTITIYSYFGELVTESIIDIMSEKSISDSLEALKTGKLVYFDRVWMQLDKKTRKVSIGPEGEYHNLKDIYITIQYPLFKFIFTEMQRMIDNEEYGELIISMDDLEKGLLGIPFLKKPPPKQIKPRIVNLPIIFASKIKESIGETTEEILEEEIDFEHVFSDLAKRVGRKTNLNDVKLGYFVEMPYIWVPGSYKTAERQYLVPEGNVVYNELDKELRYDPDSNEQTYLYPPSEMGKVKNFFKVAIGPSIKCLNEYGNNIRYLGFPIKFLRYKQCLHPLQIFESFPVEEEPKIVPDYPRRYAFLPREIIQEPISRDYDSMSFLDLKDALVNLFYLSNLGVEEEEEKMEPLTASEKRALREAAEDNVEYLLRKNIEQYKDYEDAYKDFLLEKLGWFTKEAKEDPDYEEDLDIQRSRSIELELIPEYVDDLLAEEERKTGVKLKGAKKKKKKEELTKKVKREAESYLVDNQKNVVEAMREFLLDVVNDTLDELLLIIYLPEELPEEDELRIQEELKGFIVDEDEESSEEISLSDETEEISLSDETEESSEEISLSDETEESSEEISLSDETEESSEEISLSDETEESSEEKFSEEEKGNIEIRSNNTRLKKLFDMGRNVDQISFCEENRCILEYDLRDAVISFRPYTKDETLIATDINDILDQKDKITSVEIEFEDVETGDDTELELSKFKIQKKLFSFT